MRHPPMAKHDQYTHRLVRDALSGHADAYEALYRDYFHYVFGIAYRKCNDVETTKEITQETFMKAFKSLKTYKPDEASFSTWIHRITVNVCNDLYRKTKDEKFTLDIAETEQTVMDDTPSGLDRVLDDEEKALLWKAVAALQPKLREIILLRYRDSLSYEAIANRLGIPMGTVKERIHRATAKLQEALGGEE
jgi:RNA polymerase sigma-70 factor (ECF subfamily)